MNPTATCFVIIPFSEKYNKVFSEAIKPVGAEYPSFNIKIERLDTKDALPTPFLLDNIKSSIKEQCDLVIVDLSELRPNVLFELGYAMGCEKPFIALMEEKTFDHFKNNASDLLAFHVITYSESNLEKLTKDLLQRIIPILKELPKIKEPGLIQPSWDDISIMIQNIVSNISSLFADVDLVIGVSRGGAIIASMLAGNLGHKPIYVFDRNHPGKGNNPKNSVFDHGNIDLKDKRIFLIFPEILSGRTLSGTLDFVKSKSPKDIKVITLYKSNLYQGKDVDFAYCNYDYTGKSVLFPWNLTPVYQPFRAGMEL